MQCCPKGHRPLTCLCSSQATKGQAGPRETSTPTGQSWGARGDGGENCMGGELRAGFLEERVGKIRAWKGRIRVGATRLV